MEANRNAQNLQLAHEIVFNKDFQLKLPEYEKGRSVESSRRGEKVELIGRFSIAEKVHDTMHTAFWDVLREDLSASPARYEHVIKLIGEAKEVRSFSEPSLEFSRFIFKDLKSLVLPHQTTFKSQIDESIDLETIQRRLENNAADPQEYIRYFLDMMATLCAECRDENIAKLRTITDPTEAFRYDERIEADGEENGEGGRVLGASWNCSV